MALPCDLSPAGTTRSYNPSVAHRIAGGLLALAIAGCTLLPDRTTPAGCGFPEDAPLAFAGDASLAELGLGVGDGGAVTDATIGMIYVTRDPVPFTGSIPMTPNGPADVPDFRQYCADYGDVMSLGGVPDDWTPPAR
jgi:hypothetical protein